MRTTTSVEKDIMSHPAQSETLDLRSHDIAEDKKQELLCLFPEIAL